MSIASRFYLDGEAAFERGAALAQNPYTREDEAIDWRAGWLAASHAAAMKEASGRPGGLGHMTSRFRA